MLLMFDALDYNNSFTNPDIYKVAVNPEHVVAVSWFGADTVSIEYACGRFQGCIKVRGDAWEVAGRINAGCVQK